MKVILHFGLVVALLNLVQSQIFYPAIRIHQYAVLQNGNVTVVPFIERASPAPLVPRDARGIRLEMAVTQVTPTLPNNATLVPPNNKNTKVAIPQDPSGINTQFDVREDI